MIAYNTGRLASACTSVLSAIEGGHSHACQHVAARHLSAIYARHKSNSAEYYATTNGFTIVEAGAPDSPSHGRAQPAASPRLPQRPRWDA
ncbi:hypothetical protein BV20DRAFT_81407 [Pilatotrama ljubarskyi]|nr:hypothetical protein BV20DRAFT_81407 [Pilatotrama ljubarskyi]